MKYVFDYEYHNGFQKQGISDQLKHILFAQMCKKDKAQGHLVEGSLETGKSRTPFCIFNLNMI